MNLCKIEIPEEGEEGIKNIFGEIMVEIFSKWKLQTHRFMQVNELYPH